MAVQRGRVLKWGIVFLAALVCAGLFAFLSLFGRVSSSVTYLEWESAMFMANGEPQHALDLSDPALTLHPADEGDFYRFTAVLPETSDEQLLLEVSGAEMILRLDGAELYRSAAPSQITGASGLSQIEIPLPSGAAGRTLELDCRPLEGGMGLLPLPRLENPVRAGQSDMAYANYYGIPAGMLGMAFILVCFLFAARLLAGTPDWTLPALAVAIASAVLHALGLGFGVLFLPESAARVLGTSLFGAVSPAAFLIYLLLNRRLAFWRRLGILSCISAATLAGAWLISLSRSGCLAAYLAGLATEVLQYGIYNNLVYWLTLYFIITSSLIAAYGSVEALSNARADARALSFRAELAEKSYHSLESHNRETARLRHEMRNQIAALSLLYRKGDFESLGDYLTQLVQLQAASSQVYFVQNFVVNGILQDAAARAAAAQIRFEAHASLPESLGIPDGDLCSLLMNLLDNAIEAASRVPDADKRFILFRCHLRNGFLAIHCENSYKGPLTVNPSTGWPATQKPKSADHGFGIRQMNAVAEKYHSLLDISFTGDVFTMQTALKLP